MYHSPSRPSQSPSYTGIPSLHLTALGNDNVQVRNLLAFVPRLGVLHFPDDVHTVDNLAKDDVLTVKEGGRNCGDEEWYMGQLVRGLFVSSQKGSWQHQS